MGPLRAWRAALSGDVCAAQSAARLIKETMDKKYNESWMVIIGQGFAFEVTHEVKHVLWMYLGDVSALVYKAGALQAGA